MFADVKVSAFKLFSTCLKFATSLPVSGLKVYKGNLTMSIHIKQKLTTKWATGRVYFTQNQTNTQVEIKIL